MEKLAIIGASYLQMPLVLKAKEMGLETYCFAWDDGAVCKNLVDYFYPISIIEKEEILTICSKIGIDGIVSIASDVAVITVNYVASKLGLIANPYEYTQTTTNKFLMRECFTRYNVPSPRYTVKKEGTKIDASFFQFPVIVKPTDRSGSRGVQKVLLNDDLADAIKNATQESFSKEVIVEEFVDGREISVETISWQGEHYILAITDKVTTEAPNFVELEHHQPSTLESSVQDAVKFIVEQALDALSIKNGASHTELKITEQGAIFVIEVGARMGGDFIGSDLVQLSTGFDFVKAVIEISLGKFEEPKITEHSFSGVYFLCKETEYLKPVFDASGQYNQIVKIEKTDNELHSIKCSADRSGYLIYKDSVKLILKNK